MSGWGSLFGKISEQFQSRIERLKNEKAKLETELKQIQSKPSTDESAKREGHIIFRINEIKDILANNAKD